MVSKKTESKVRPTMKIAICDDNLEFLQLFQQTLETQFALRDWIYKCEVFQSGESLLKSDLSDVYAVFLDIDMPGLNGLDVARRLRLSHPDIIIVFVTAFIQYAVDGYSVEALRYLIKDRLVRDLPACLDAIQEKIFVNEDTIQVQTVSNRMTFRVRDIIYVEGTPQRHSILHHSSSGEIECVGKITDFESTLREKGFVRIQRSYLVNMMYIDNLCSYTATLSNGETLSVSRKLYREISLAYIKWKGHRI